jgi:S-(hydroxymethyl)glutathione dehydrogenase/alcohol dehydrogenase
MRAAIFNAPHEELTFEDIDVSAPIGYEVLVRTAASGVCHSDLHFVDGLYPMRGPAVLGHEAAGVVEAVGPNVTEVTPGDHVIACLSVYCGSCDNCLVGATHLCENRPARTTDEGPRLSKDGQAVAQFASIGSYAEQMLLHQNGVVKIDKDVPFDVAALIGCGVTTGVGAALNTAKVEPGSTVAVFGAGGVGLSAIQGARIAGARMIIAVDMVEHKLQTARELGATHSVDASLLGEKKLQGSSMGSNRFKVDMPKYIDFYRQGRLKLDEMVTKRGKLEDVNDAFESMRNREVARTVLMFD